MSWAKALLQLRLLLGSAAVLDHQGLPLKGAHVGQGLQQDFGFFDVFLGSWFMPSGSKFRVSEGQGLWAWSDCFTFEL